VAGKSRSLDRCQHAGPETLWKFEVFISHAGEQKPFARELGDSLRSIGIRAFVDKEDLHAGDHSGDVMLGSANSAPVGVAVFSPHFFDKARSPVPLCMHVAALNGVNL
jgi:hypothetical protein